MLNNLISMIHMPVKIPTTDIFANVGLVAAPYIGSHFTSVMINGTFWPKDNPPPFLNTIKLPYIEEDEG